MNSFFMDEGWFEFKCRTNENEFKEYSARYSMYLQEMLYKEIMKPKNEKQPALTNEDRFIQHIIKEYSIKEKI